MKRWPGYFKHCSPAWLLLGFATGLGVAFLGAHFAGWREYTAFISGTIAAPNAALGQALGMLYLVVYFAAVIVAPILALAAVLLLAWQRLFGIRLRA